MGSWAYCRSCDLGIGPPTLREALVEEIVCERCGEVKHLDKYDKDLALFELEERLETIEKKCENLHKLVDTLLARR